MVAVISAVLAAIVTKLSVSTLIVTIYLPCKITLHNFGEPHYIRQFNKTICTHLWNADEFHFPLTGNFAMSRNGYDQ